MRIWSVTAAIQGSALSVGLGLALISSACQMSGDEEWPSVGESSAPIVGGSSTTQYPAVPLLYAEFPDVEGAQVCTGTLISPRVILTAAHCVEFLDGPPSNFLAYFGANATVQSDPASLGAVPVTDYVFDQNWDGDNLEAGHDIGLVLLAQNAPVSPMPFNRADLAPHVGQPVHLVGWGRTSGDGEDVGVKREVTSTLDGANDLLMQYGSPTANTCQGDSGGPNFMTIDGVEVVAGITSFGNVGCDEYGFGTRVDTFAESFIDPYIAQNDPSASPPAGGDGEGDGDGGGDDGSGDGDGDDGQAVSGGCSTGEGRTHLAGALAVCLLMLAGTYRRSRSRVRARAR